MDTTDKPPLPTRNLFRLVQNLKAIAERRKIQHDQRECADNPEECTSQEIHDECKREESSNDEKDASKTSSDSQAGKIKHEKLLSSNKYSPGKLSGEVSTSSDLPQFKGKLPCQVSLAELTAEFRALSVTQIRLVERGEQRKQAVSATSPWQPLAPGDAEFHRMLPSQMWDHVHCGEDVEQTVTDEQFLQWNESQRTTSRPATSRGFPRGQQQTLLAGPNLVMNSGLAHQTYQLPSRPQLPSWTAIATPSPQAQQQSYGLPQDLQQRDWTLLAGPNLVMNSGLAHQTNQLPSQPQPPSWTALAAPSPQAQKQMLGERLFPLIKKMNPSLGGKITGMLLELDNSELLHLLQSPQSLQARVDEAVAVLQAHEAKQKRSAATAQQKPSGHPSAEMPSQEPWTAATLAAAPSYQLKQMIGERLFPLIQRMYPDLAGKITVMLLEIDNSELLHMLDSQEALKARVEEVVAVLQAHMAKEAADKTKCHQVNKNRSAAAALQKTTGHPSTETLNKEPLTDAMLAAVLPSKRKQKIGERLFPLIQRMYPDLAGKITVMLLEIDNSELLHMLDSQEALKAKVEEAAAVLQAHIAKEAADKTKCHQVNKNRSAAAALQKTTGHPSAETLNKEPLTDAMLAAVLPSKRKQMIGERLFPLLEKTHPNLAVKITVMLLEMSNYELLQLLQSPQLLQAKADEAVAVLEVHQPVLSQHLYPLVANIVYPDLPLACRITQSLLQLENTVIYKMLQSRDLLLRMVMQTCALPANEMQIRDPSSLATAPRSPQHAAASLQQAVLMDVSGPSSATHLPEPLTKDMLVEAAPELQKTMLRERLQPFIKSQYPDLVDEITEVMLRSDNAEVLHVLQSPQSLKVKVDEAADAVQQASLLTEPIIDASAAQTDAARDADLLKKEEVESTEEEEGEEEEKQKQEDDDKTAGGKRGE